MTSTPNIRRPFQRRRPTTLGPDDWLDAARDVLIHEGIERVKIEPLADKLNVSRGSFYWHFTDRQALLDALLNQWQETALAPMQAVAADETLDAHDRYERFMRVWVQGEPSFPVYDLAIRRWALVSPEVQHVVRKTDLNRIKMLTSIFRDMGYDSDEAMIRARIAYFHQVGYYATDLRESRKRREKYWPLYAKILAPRD